MAYEARIPSRVAKARTTPRLSSGRTLLWPDTSDEYTLGGTDRRRRDPAGREDDMAATLRVARLYFVLLAVVTAGRWLMGTFGVPYADGHHIFSIVILTVFSCLYYGAFTRRWLDHRLIQAVLLGVLMGLTSQIVILVLTAVSYALGMETYFNHPTALNSPVALSFGRAMVVRVSGLIGNSIGAGITAALGWALGGLLPRR
jgi:hypothetical protein